MNLVDGVCVFSLTRQSRVNPLVADEPRQGIKTVTEILHENKMPKVMLHGDTNDIFMMMGILLLHYAYASVLG